MKPYYDQGRMPARSLPEAEKRLDRSRLAYLWAEQESRARRRHRLIRAAIVICAGLVIVGIDLLIRAVR